MEWRAEPVAQSVEHVTFNHGVAGSSPAGLTNNFNMLGDKIGALSSQKTGLGRLWEEIWHTGFAGISRPQMAPRDLLCPF
jgi:hypothetical protein